MASHVGLLTKFRRKVPDEGAACQRWRRVRQLYVHRCVGREEQRIRVNDLWSQVIRWDAQLAGSEARRPRDDLHARDSEVCDEVPAVGTSRDRAVGREATSRTSVVQYEYAVKRVLLLTPSGYGCPQRSGTREVQRSTRLRWMQ